MALLGTRFYVAFDALAVSAATVAEGFGGRRAGGFVRVPLEPGALAPSPSGTSLARAEEVRAAVRRAAAALGGSRATLLLPDGVGRVALLDQPEGAVPRDYVRFRLAASLPWPVSEAVVEALPAGRGRVVGAAVRRAVVAEFEQAAVAAGLEIEQVHLAPLVALEGLMRSRPREAVHAVLGDVALCLAAFRDGALVGLRSRRRDRSPGEAERLREEARRASAAADSGAFVVSGSGALRLRRDLGGRAAGNGLDGPAEWPEAAEAAWLGGLVA